MKRIPFTSEKVFSYNPTKGCMDSRRIFIPLIEHTYDPEKSSAPNIQDVVIEKNLFLDYEFTGENQTCTCKIKGEALKKSQVLFDQIKESFNILTKEQKKEVINDLYQLEPLQKQVEEYERIESAPGLELPSSRKPNNEYDEKDLELLENYYASIEDTYLVKNNPDRNKFDLAFKEKPLAEKSGNSHKSDLFINEVIKLLFQEPVIVDLFFSTEDDSPLEVNTLKNYPNSILPSDIEITQHRLETAIIKNVEIAADNVSIPDKSEGFFAYYEPGNKKRANGKIKKSTDLSAEDLFLGWVPCAAIIEDGNKKINRADCLTKRSVEYNFKFDLDNCLSDKVKKYNSEDEIGCIHPDLANIAKVGNKGYLIDNKLLFSWSGDSLGCESPLQFKDDGEVVNEKGPEEKVAEFIKKFIYEKHTALPKNQLPLIAGRSYQFIMIPKYFHGGLHINDTGSLENILKRVSEWSDKVEYKILENLCPPEIIPEKKWFWGCSKESNSSQVIFEHDIDERKKDSLIRYILLPPKVDFNLMRWQGGCNADFNIIEPWLDKLNFDIPKCLKRGLTNIPYVFDSRAIDQFIEISVWDFNDEIDEKPAEKEEKVKFPLKLHNFYLNKLEPLNLEFVSERAIKDVKIEEIKGGLQCIISEGRELKFKFKFQDNDKFGVGEKVISVINPVPSFETTDIPENMSTSLKVEQISRKAETGISKDYLLECSLLNLNFYIAGYFYLFRKYRKVFPAEFTSLPSLTQLINKRNTEKKSNPDKETDNVLFNIKEDDISETAERSFEVCETFSINNVFSVEEVFGVDTVDLLSPITEEGEVEQIRGNKIFFNRSEKLGDYKHFYSYQGDERSKKIDYLNAKVYSKYLSHFKKGNIPVNLRKLDSNFTDNNKESGWVINDGFGKRKVGEVDFIDYDPPEFEIDLLHRFKKESDLRETSRDSLVILTFKQEQLNRISDNEYIGIDFTESEKKVHGKSFNVKNTDIGVDFIFQDERVTDLDVNKVSESVNKILENRIEFEQDKVETDSNYLFIKPLFLYKENKGFILLDFKDFHKEFDPFLKISLCRAYKDHEGKWVKTVSSPPKFIQLSSKRTFALIQNCGKLTITNKSLFKFNTREKKRIYFLAFYPKCSDAFNMPLEFVKNDVKQRYLFIEFNDSGKFIEDTTAFKLTIGKPFYLVDYVIRIFEFMYYDNSDIENLKNNLNSGSFNPVNSPELKLMLVCDL